MANEQNEKLKKESEQQVELVRQEHKKAKKELERLQTDHGNPQDITKAMNKLRNAEAKLDYEEERDKLDKQKMSEEEAHNEKVKGLDDKIKNIDELLKGDLSPEERKKLEAEKAKLEGELEQENKQYSNFVQQNDGALEKAWQRYQDCCDRNNQAMQKALEQMRAPPPPPSMGAPSSTAGTPVPKFEEPKPQGSEKSSEQPSTVFIKGDNALDVFKEYQEYQKSRGKVAEPIDPKLLQTKDPEFKLSFESKKEENDFLKKQAESGKAFTVSNETKDKIIGFSNGDSTYKNDLSEPAQNFTMPPKSETPSLT